jgi:hypothetical protein
MNLPFSGEISYFLDFSYVFLSEMTMIMHNQFVHSKQTQSKNIYLFL